jgi:hypothetical protein
LNGPGRHGRKSVWDWKEDALDWALAFKRPCWWPLPPAPASAAAPPPDSAPPYLLHLLSSAPLPSPPLRLSPLLSHLSCLTSPHLPCLPHLLSSSPQLLLSSAPRRSSPFPPQVLPLSLRSSLSPSGPPSLPQVFPLALSSAFLPEALLSLHSFLRSYDYIKVLLCLLMRRANTRCLEGGGRADRNSASVQSDEVRRSGCACALRRGGSGRA